MDHVPGQALAGFVVVGGNGLALTYAKARMTPREPDLRRRGGRWLFHVFDIVSPRRAPRPCNGEPWIRASRRVLDLKVA
jgi:hypothetical protein